ncbi:XRE family transcriptional regulator [Pseudaminobacter arsenicus]|uniref:XRE family transcriptional regulator n=1 Tax=Borborobacter arsenicus TaxID=1851146 RepID=A0A432V706_9HYPH|nr:XRE family transcriptional regulator [Pseudaminobacter arsenicus]RUM97964.1 XRE family transcriptional regulator [Pseudaminobacter arsenicus]
MITGPMCRAARALVEIKRERLSRVSGIDETTIENFERKIAIPEDDAVLAIQAALEEHGAVFIPENGGGVGVRLKFTKSETKRIGILESEGGVSRNDDVP